MTRDHLVDAVDAVADLIIDLSDPAYRVERAAWACDVIAYASGLLWADGKGQRRAARLKRRDGQPDLDDAVTAVTTGLAVLAHRPAGVTFGGRHWCAAPHTGCPGSGQDELPSPVGGIGVHYTPPALAQEIVLHTLQPLTHRLDLSQTPATWSLPMTAPEILDRTVCDPTCGAGAMLVAGARYLADRVVEAWGRADVLGPDPTRLALRMVVSRCVYGVDAEPVAVELARLALRLLVPLDDVDVHIDRRVRCGDSLIGVTNLDQLRHMHLDGATSGTVPLDESHPELWRDVLSALDAVAAERTA